MSYHLPVSTSDRIAHLSRLISSIVALGLFAAGGTCGAGAGHRIDVEGLFDHVCGIGRVVVRDPVLDAADAVVGRGGLGDITISPRCD